MTQVKGFGSRRSRSGQIFEIFEILGGAGDVNNSISIPNYRNGLFSDLGKCVNKVLSAWADVWSATCPSSASIIAAEGRDLDIFFCFWARLVTHT